MSGCRSRQVRVRQDHPSQVPMQPLRQRAMAVEARMIPTPLRQRRQLGFGQLLLAALLALFVMWALGFARNVITWTLCSEGDFGAAIVATAMYDGPSAGECALVK